MAEAFGWGALGAAALLTGALIAYLLSPSRAVIAVVMALGTGLLIGSVSFELVDDALEHQDVAWVALMVLLGAAVFTVGDWLLSRRGGGERKDPTGAQADGRALAIVLGSVLDGIPESWVLGLTGLQGGGGGALGGAGARATDKKKNKKKKRGRGMSIIAAWPSGFVPQDFRITFPFYF